MSPPPGSSRPKGKLLVLLDVPSGGKATKGTGLEKLLSDFSVQAKNERILTVPSERNEIPELVSVVMNPDVSGSNPIAKAFQAQDLSGLYNARPVAPAPPPEGRPPMENRYSAQVLMQAPPGQELWTTGDLQSDLRTLVLPILRNPG